MTKISADWLKEWIEKNKRHRTANKGGLLACPEQMSTTEVAVVDRFHYCPLCGTELGPIHPEEEKNYSWDN